ncbi:tetracycline resistance MFS efflux pump [Amylibacter marinus]|uniref:Tetracycline resistance MFS efflux pump n=1 Tax=Amylibacter marinus TaxID=1475483 RepID=A0ABQ5VXS5_9RHOB|nr:TCR/Tet family MFS transporter [Amylibacter marinus]GLQ36233.1 tetracycline resistance MFS efflux pump [Amylibacter marinus]
MNKRLALIFVLLTLVIDAIGIGIIMPVTPDLIQELLGANLAAAALWGGALSASFAVMQFLFSPLIGGLSDRYGRKPVLLLSLFVVGIDYLIMGFTGSIWVLLIGRCIAGIASATQSTASAFIADISDPETKAQNFALVGAAFGIGFILGPVLGGLFAEISPRAPFFAAAALALANCAFGWLILSETVTDKIRRALSWRRINPLGALMNVSGLPSGAMMLGVVFLHNVAFFAYPSVWAYFTIERFDWSPKEVGFSLAAFGLTVAVAQAGLMRPLVARFGEWGVLMIGLVCSITAGVLISLATQGWMIYGLIFSMALSFLITPALQAIMSRLTPDDSQGELQGVLTSISALAVIISPLLMTFVFGYFSGPKAPFYMPGAPYLLAGIFDLIVLIVVYSIWRQRRRGATNAPETVPAAVTPPLPKSDQLP